MHGSRPPHRRPDDRLDEVGRLGKQFVRPAAAAAPRGHHGVRQETKLAAAAHIGLRLTESQPLALMMAPISE